jgi:hypothetical protein
MLTKFARKPEGKIPLGRPRRRCKDNIKMAHKELWCKGVDFIQLPHYWDLCWDLVNMEMNLRVP